MSNEESQNKQSEHDAVFHRCPFRIVLPRPQNRRFPLELRLTKQETQFLPELMLSDEVIETYAQLESRDKINFIQNRLMLHIPVDAGIFTFQEDIHQKKKISNEDLTNQRSDINPVPGQVTVANNFYNQLCKKMMKKSHNDLIKYLYRKMNLKANSISRKRAKISSQHSLLALDRKVEATTKASNSLRKSSAHQTHLKKNILKSIPALDELYAPESDDVLKTIKEQCNYSMIHTLYEPINFIVYNGSHRVKPNTCVHRCTKINLFFPSSIRTYAIIFDGDLVHSGAKSKLEDSFKSFNFSTDLRAFSYVTSSNHPKESYCSKSIQDRVNTASVRLCEEGLDKTSDNHQKSKPVTYNPVQRKSTTSQQIHKKTGTNSSCVRCDHIIDSMKHWSHLYNAVYIDVENEAIRTNKNMKKSHPKYVLGNLKELGWVIYEGVDLHNDDRYNSLRHDLLSLVHGSQFKKQWKTIQTKDSENKKTGGSRSYMRIDMLEERLMKKMNENHNQVLIFFDDIQKQLLDQVPELHGFKLTSKSILGNFGYVSEQQAHRDYDPG